MAAIPVVGYRLGISVQGNRGRVILRLQDGQQIPIDADSPAEFAAVALVLKESPVTYDPANGGLMTGWEQGN